MRVELQVDVAAQRLRLIRDGLVLRQYPVSTAKNGVGELNGSYCTPRGKHRICLKIGEKCPVNTVFVGRRPSGEIYTPELARQYPGRDWILTRILWLHGLQPGFNRGGRCDSRRRFIYIHGTAEEQLLGRPVSHGCIRMSNRNIVELFDIVAKGTLVTILEHTS